MTLRTTKPFRRGNDVSGSVEPQLVWDADIDIGTQIRQSRAAVASAFLSGVALSMASGLGAAAYLTSGDAVPAATIASFFGLSGFCFGAYAVAVSGRLLRYLHYNEIIIASQECAILESRKAINAMWFSSEGEAAGAWGRGSSTDAATPAANVFPINRKPH